MLTRDFAKACRLVRVLPAGRGRINTYRTASSRVPFGGTRNSGHGREARVNGMRDYIRTKGLLIDVPGQPMAGPFMTR